MCFAVQKCLGETVEFVSAEDLIELFYLIMSTCCRDPEGNNWNLPFRVGLVFRVQTQYAVRFANRVDTLLVRNKICPHTLVEEESFKTSWYVYVEWRRHANLPKRFRKGYDWWTQVNVDILTLLAAKGHSFPRSPPCAELTPLHHSETLSAYSLGPNEP